MINRFWKISVFVISIFVIVPCFFPRCAFARDDWQNWNSFGLKAKLTDEIKFRVGGELRLTDDMSELTVSNVDTGFLWQPVDFFDIGPIFKYERSKGSGGAHTNERRYYLEFNLKTKLRDVAFSNRGRLAYRDRNTTDGWRYRNNFKVAYPIPIKKIRVFPYASEEIFWSIDEHSLNQNRLKMGFSTELTDRLSIDLYYMMKSDRSGNDWNDTHVLGTGVTISI